MAAVHWTWVSSTRWGWSSSPVWALNSTIGWSLFRWHTWNVGTCTPASSYADLENCVQSTRKCRSVRNGCILTCVGLRDAYASIWDRPNGHVYWSSYSCSWLCLHYASLIYYSLKDMIRRPRAPVWVQLCATRITTHRSNPSTRSWTGSRPVGCTAPERPHNHTDARLLLKWRSSNHPPRAACWTARSSR